MLYLLSVALAFVAGVALAAALYCGDIPRGMKILVTVVASMLAAASAFFWAEGIKELGDHPQHLFSLLIPAAVFIGAFLHMQGAEKDFHAKHG